MLLDTRKILDDLYSGSKDQKMPILQSAKLAGTEDFGPLVFGRGFYRISDTPSPTRITKALMVLLEVSSHSRLHGWNPWFRTRRLRRPLRSAHFADIPGIGFNVFPEGSSHLRGRPRRLDRCVRGSLCDSCLHPSARIETPTSGGCRHLTHSGFVPDD